MANCPRCNMFLAPGAQFCPNCQLNLMQYSYQPQQPQNFIPPMSGGDVSETKKEELGYFRSKIRRILVKKDTSIIL